MNTDEKVDAFLEHFGKKGMQWGVRNSRPTSAQQRDARAKGLGPNQLRGEAKRVAAAGGGIRGTLAVRREMIASGQLSKEQAHKGLVGFGRNIALGILAGAAVGAVVGNGVGKLGQMLVKDIL